MGSSSPSDPEGTTGQLCDWIHSISLADVPSEIQTRTKYLILDGLACALLGAHLPESEAAAHAVMEMESPGSCSIIGWEKKLGPLAAALLNSTFIQSFELDDYHKEAPIHGSSVVLPALLAAVEQVSKRPSGNRLCPVSGKSFLLAALLGYEVGPRVGLGVYGGDVLSRGWHSGAVFGPAASAAATSKLLRMSSGTIEDAIGIACTQAGGLMSAQYESMVKRMQHGFAARNGLFAALMAQGQYVGIKQVLERPYGGFLSNYSLGNNRNPPFQPMKVVEGLGKDWEINGIIVKPYASMAATHATVDCITELQRKHPEELKDFANIRGITVEMSEPAFRKGGWLAKRPLTCTGAQMSAAYAAAVQLIDGQVLPTQFGQPQMDRDEVWDLVNKIQCVHNPEFSVDKIKAWHQRVIVDLANDRPALQQLVLAPKGINPPLSNEEVLSKWRKITEGVIKEDRRQKIEDLVLGIEDLIDVAELVELLVGRTENPLH